MPRPWMGWPCGASAIFGASVLAGCAAGNPAGPNALGTVAVYNGAAVQHWPAHLIKWYHQSNAAALPVNKRLWEAGHTIAGPHCFLTDSTGRPEAVTFLGLSYAAEYDIVDGAFGGHIPANEVRAAKSAERSLQIYVETIWRLSSGSPERIQQLLRTAIDIDAECLRKIRKNNEVRYELQRQNLASVRDMAGRPGVAPIKVNARDHRAFEGVLLANLRGHEQRVRSVIAVYGVVADQLSRKSGPALASVSPPAITSSIERSEATAPGSPSETARKAAQVLKPVRPMPSPVRSAATRITVNTAPLDQEQAETMASIAKAKEFCLARAATECA